MASWVANSKKAIIRRVLPIQVQVSYLGCIPKSNFPDPANFIHIHWAPHSNPTRRRALHFSPLSLSSHQSLPPGTGPAAAGGGGGAHSRRQKEEHSLGVILVGMSALFIVCQSIKMIPGKLVVPRGARKRTFCTGRSKNQFITYPM